MVDIRRRRRRGQARSRADSAKLYRQIIATEQRVLEQRALYRIPFRHSGSLRQLSFNFLRKNANGFRDPAFSENKTQPLHRWVPWIAGFSSQFVEDCFDTFVMHGRRKSRPNVLDPFAGVGTTLVQALVNGFDTVGFEINPYAALACKVKLGLPKLDLATLETYCEEYRMIAAKGNSPIAAYNPSEFKTRIPFFSPRIEEQILIFLDFVRGITHAEIADIFRVALGSVMVSFSNYTYEPSLSSRPAVGKPLVEKADVHSTILRKLHEMISDIRWFKERTASPSSSVGQGQIYNSSFMESAQLLPANSIDLVVTSPPYMNNYHYVRNTRPQLFWLSLIASPKDLRVLEEANFGKYWQTVRDSPPVELCFDHPELCQTLARLRRTRREKGSYGGPGWANYVSSYFNDCYQFVRILKRALVRGGVGVVVIGNSIIQGHEIRTDLVLADIAHQTGLELRGVQPIRTKRVGASITQSAVRRGHGNSATLYESAVVVRKK